MRMEFSEATGVFCQTFRRGLALIDLSGGYADDGFGELVRIAGAFAGQDRRPGRVVGGSSYPRLGESRSLPE
jgi:hypothetical protein